MITKKLPKKISSNAFISVTKAAKILHLSPDTLRNWEKQGKLVPQRTAGGARRYSVVELHKLEKQMLPLRSKKIGVLAVSTAAKELGVSADTLRSWTRKGLIDGTRTKGGARRFSRAEIARLQKELGIEKKEIEPQLEKKSEIIAHQLAVPEAKTQKLVTPNHNIEPKVHRFSFNWLRFLMVIILFFLLLDLGLFLNIDRKLASIVKQGDLDDLASKMSTQTGNVVSSLENIQRSLLKLEADSNKKPIYIAASSITGDYVKSITAGAGLTGDGSGEGSSPTLAIGGGNGILVDTDNISLDLTDSSNSSNTSANSGLELSSDGLSLLRGCSDNQVLSWDTGGSIWRCESIAGVGGGDITSVGSMTSGDAFTDSSADDQWLGLGSSAGRIEFDNQAIDEVNILSANLGLGTSTPGYLLELYDSTNTPELALGDDDVAHGLTSLAQTDIFFHLSSLSTTAGGAQLTAISDADSQALAIRAVIGSIDPTDSTAAIKIIGSKSDGATGMADLASTETVFQIANNDNTPALTVSGSGNIGIGDITPIEAQLVLSGDIFVGSLATANSERLCWDGSGGSLITDCSGTPGDYAEEYGTDDSGIEAGDIVIADPLKPASEVEKDKLVGSKAWIIKSNQTYQNSIIGVVSTKPNEVIGQNFDSTENPRPVALNGRVPIKVSIENGPIEIGDFLTSSSTPGVAMRATRPGQVIGKALEPFSSLGVKKILAFVNISLADPQNILANLTLDDQGKIITGKNQDQLNLGAVSFDSDPNQISSKFEALNSSVTDLILAEANTLSKLDEIEKKVNDVQNRLAQKEPQPSPNLNLETPDILLATDSASLVDNKLMSLTVSEDFRALGDSFLGKTTIAGSLVVDGLFSVENGNEVNVIGLDSDKSGVLYLQKSPLAQGLDIFDGLVKIDKKGNLFAQTITVADFRVIAHKISGSGTLPKDSVSVEIKNPLITSTSRILLTPTSEIDNVIAVTEKIDGQGFVVSVSSPLSKDTSFDWWLVNEVEAP